MGQVWRLLPHSQQVCEQPGAITDPSAGVRLPKKGMITRADARTWWPQPNAMSFEFVRQMGQTCPSSSNKSQPINRSTQVNDPSGILSMVLAGDKNFMGLPMNGWWMINGPKDWITTWLSPEIVNWAAIHAWMMNEMVMARHSWRLGPYMIVPWSAHRRSRAWRRIKRGIGRWTLFGTGWLSSFWADGGQTRASNGWGEGDPGWRFPSWMSEAERNKQWWGESPRYNQSGIKILFLFFWFYPKSPSSNVALYCDGISISAARANSVSFLDWDTLFDIISVKLTNWTRKSSV